MRSVSNFMLALASVSFLTITLSGFHPHADVNSHDEHAPHSYAHQHAPPPEFDEDHIDISVFEPATGFAKAEIVALSPTLPELASIPRLDNPWSADRRGLSPQRQVRWRPELRGPPLST